MIDKTWLNDYIEQMKYEVQENWSEGCESNEENGDLEYPEDYYCLGLFHGEHKGVLDTLKLIKGKLE